LAEDVHGGDPALVLAEVREHCDAGDVADRPDAVRGPAALIDVDAARVGLDADGLEADASRPWTAAGRDNDLRAVRLVAVVELDDLLAALGVDADGAAADQEADSVLLQDLLQQPADPRVLAVGEARRSLDDRHRAAEAGQELRQLDRDDAAADED